MLVLGDRFEILGACLAATHAQVPIAHIHGGESTAGSFDDQIRHAVTKLAHLHFAAAEPYAERLRRMGEGRIWVTGAPGLDNLADLPPRVPAKYFVVTYHPETNGEGGPTELMEALSRFPDYPVMWTGVNNDPGAEVVRRTFGRRFLLSDLTADQYLRFARNAAAVVGNSSSGIIECPTLGVPTVNIGSRQRGRLQGPSIFNAGHDADDIAQAIRKALDYTGPYANPYGGPGASRRIAEVLETIDLRGVREKPWFS